MWWTEMEEKLRDYGWKKGEESEEKVCRALEELKAEGTIKNFGQSLKFYQEDRSGRDILITTNDDKLIWLQVKSSFNSAEKTKYQKRGIHYLGGVREKTLEEIKKEILEVLKRKNRSTKISVREKIEVSI